MEFDSGSDRLWLVGDVVNRGPRSADVLRWLIDHQDQVTTVLGNHDLQVCARFLDVLDAGPGDTAFDLLEARNADQLIGWLLTRPLLHQEDSRLLVHAGISPRRKLRELKKSAARLERKLKDFDRAASLLKKHFALEHSGTIEESDLAILKELTLLRACRPNGEMLEDFTDPPEKIPKGFSPWFEFWGDRNSNVEVYFGHWARLGLYLGQGVTGLDTGCVHGGQLTGLRLDDHKIFQVENMDGLKR